MTNDKQNHFSYDPLLKMIFAYRNTVTSQMKIKSFYRAL